MAKRWNYETGEMEPYEIPADWDCPLICYEMDRTVNCASCGRPLPFGNTFTSLEIMTEIGGSFGVCRECYEAEKQRRYGVMDGIEPIYFDGTLKDGLPSPEDIFPEVPKTCGTCKAFMYGLWIKDTPWDGWGMCCAGLGAKFYDWQRCSDAACEEYEPLKTSKQEQLWLGSFGDDPANWPYMLEGNDVARLYKTQTWSIGTDNNSHGTTPVYHIWTEDDWLSTEHYRDAYKAWADRVQEGKHG